MIDHLVRTAASGAFAGPNHARGMPGATWVTRGSVGPRGSWGELAHPNAGLPFWRALIQVLVQYHFYVTPIAALRVAEPPPAPERPALDLATLLATPYPDRPENGPFPLLRSPGAEAVNELHLLLAQPTAAEARATVQRTAEDWTTTVYLGAYAYGKEATTTSETFTLGEVSVALVRADSLVVALENWGLSSAALDGLLAVLEGVHRGRFPFAAATLA